MRNLGLAIFAAFSLAACSTAQMTTACGDLDTIHADFLAASVAFNFSPSVIAKELSIYTAAKAVCMTSVIVPLNSAQTSTVITAQKQIMAAKSSNSVVTGK